MIAVGRRSFVAGFELAGIGGVEVGSATDALKAITRLIKEREMGLILVSDDVAKPIRSQLTEIRSKQPVPLIYEVPAPGGKAEKMEYRDMLKQILGI